MFGDGWELFNVVEGENLEQTTELCSSVLLRSLSELLLAPASSTDAATFGFPLL
jgi:hypothetical protein